MPSSRVDDYQKLLYIEPLYEAAHIMTKPDNSEAEQEELRKMAEPIMERCLDIIRLQLQLANIFGPKYINEDRYDYGFVGAACDYGLSVVRTEDDACGVVSLNTHEADEGESLLVSGFLTGVVFGYDISQAAQFTPGRAKYEPQTGLWICLAPEPATDPTDIKSEFMVQLPHATLLMPDSIQN